MTGTMWLRAALAAAVLPAASPPPAPPHVVSTLALAKPFGARSDWRFIVDQGPSVDDPIFPEEDKLPGAVRLCLKKTASNSCVPLLKSDAKPDDLFTTPHYLNDARIVRPRGETSPPLLWVQTASIHSGDGDQLVWTRVLAYRRGSDRFDAVYDHTSGHNNNQQTRYVDAGSLRGDVVSVEPTRDAPFGFWVTVNALTPAYAYRPVLRYRSATRYNDGNPLAVIDSEMPEIQRRLGLRRPGSPLPLPARPCPKPHLIHAELWCG